MDKDYQAYYHKIGDIVFTSNRKMYASEFIDVIEAECITESKCVISVKWDRDGSKEVSVKSLT